MSTNSWSVQADGRYVIDAIVGTLPVRLMIDTGLVDPSGHVGLELQPTVFDQLAASGELSEYRMRFRGDSSGRRTELRTAKVQAGLANSNDPTCLIGTQISIRVARGNFGVPDRVGVAFFHRLAGCEVHWDCPKKTWAISIRES